MTEPSDSLTDPLAGRSGATSIQPPPGSILGQPEIPPEQASGKQFKLEGDAKMTSSHAPSPMDIASDQRRVTPQELIQHITSLKGELTPQRFGELTAGQRSLLTAKMRLFNENVQDAATQMGVPHVPPNYSSSALQDVRTYLSWLTNGQRTIEGVCTQITRKQGAGTLSESDMLRLQAKLMQAERAINFASAVAGKGADFIKTMMQQQI